MHCLPEIQSELASWDFVCFLAWGLFACLLLPSWPVSLPSDPAPAGWLPQTPLPLKAEPCRTLHGGDRLTPRCSTSGQALPSAQTLTWQASCFCAVRACQGHWFSLICFSGEEEAGEMTEGFVVGPGRGEVSALSSEFPPLGPA